MHLKLNKNCKFKIENLNKVRLQILPEVESDRSSLH